MADYTTATATVHVIIILLSIVPTDQIVRESTEQFQLSSDIQILRIKKQR